MASGVNIPDECKQHFLKLKLGRKYRYVVYCLSSNMKEIMVSADKGPEGTWDDLVEEQFKPAEDKQECRYAVFDAEYNLNDGQTRNKLIFIMWSPEGAKIKQKMVYASSKTALKAALGDGLAKELQANDHGDLAWSNVLELCMRTGS